MALIGQLHLSVMAKMLNHLNAIIMALAFFSIALSLLNLVVLVVPWWCTSILFLKLASEFVLAGGGAKRPKNKETSEIIRGGIPTLKL